MVRLKQWTLRTQEEKGLKVLYASKEHHTSLGQLGDETELNNQTSEANEAFACAVYTEGTKVNDVLYWMFCQNGHGNENLRPTSDTLQQNMTRGNYQACMWKKALEATQNLRSVTKWIWLENTGSAARAHDERTSTTGSSGGDCFLLQEVIMSPNRLCLRNQQYAMRRKLCMPGWRKFPESKQHSSIHGR